MNLLQRVAFDVSRKLLITLTGTGADRSRAMNDLHHKLSNRLHRKLGIFGLAGETRIALKNLPGKTLRMLAEDGGVAHQFLVYGKYEPFESALVMAAIVPGDTILNIGANLGYYTILAAAATGEEGRVVAFEPSATNAILLKKNIADNHFRNVTVREEAVSDREGSLKLYLSKTNSGDHQIYSSDESRQFQEVCTVRLDDVIRSTTLTPSLVIMDVQGAEAQVLRGFRTYLANRQRHPIAMFLEFGPRNLSNAGDSADALLDLLAEFNLRYVVIDERKRILRSLDKETLIGETTGHNEKNLLVFDAHYESEFLTRMHAVAGP